MVLLLVASLAFQREVFETQKTGASWHSGSAWAGGRRPGSDDRALIPGGGQDHEMRINGDRKASITSLLIGRRRNSGGILEVFGDLRVAGVNGNGENNASQLILGGPDNERAVLRLKSGSDLYVGKLLRVGDFDRSTGKVFVRRARLRTPGTISLAGSEEGIGVLEVRGGGSRIVTKSLVMGKGDARLVFTRGEDGMTPVQVTTTARLRGTLKVRIPEGSGTPRIIPIVQFTNGRARRTGGFRRVQVDAPDGKHYELNYILGPNARDIGLVRLSQPLNTFEKWRPVMLERAPSQESIHPRADPDADGLSNLGEYKLGSHPLVDEDDLFLEGVEEDGRRSISFSERVDRQDVTTTVQTSFDGRVWTSANVETEVVNRFGNSRTVRAIANTNSSKLRFRLYFEREAENNVQPSVLFVMVDDLNDFVEPLGGHPQAMTPNFNALAARGTLFTNAHSASTICNPSRVAIMTGIRPSRSGVYGNSHALRDSPLLRNMNTMPQHFRSKGYRVVGSGKIFHSAEPNIWAEYFPSRTQHRPDDPMPSGRLSGVPGLRPNFDFGPLNVSDGQMGDYKVASWVSNWLQDRRAKDGPAFMACGFFRPHLPLYVPSRHFRAWRTTDLEVPLVLNNDLNDVPEAALTASIRDDEHGQIRDAGRWKKAIHAYLAAVRFADAQLGRVISALDDSEIARNTIIVVCSDHGWHLGEKNAWRKNTLWEESTRVPLLIVAPGVTTPGTRCDEAVSLLDLFPTLVDLADFNIPSRLDGTSLLPQLLDPTEPREEPAITSRSRSAHSVRTERYRLTERDGDADEFYDHSIDPNEWFNLIDNPDYADEIEDLRQYVPANPAEPIGS